MSGEFTLSEDLSAALEALLSKHYRLSPFTCSVGVSADGNRLAAVGIKLHGNSRHRKGRWTRCAIAASCHMAEGVEGLVPRLRKLYADFAANRHRNVNHFRPRRRHRALGGMR
jgi:hypothetical protein